MCCLLTDQHAVVCAQSPTADDASLKRYVELLERQPKYGTVFDKIYSQHAERGSLDEFVARYRQQMKSASSNNTAAFIVGLIELQRGRDSDAVAALRAAESARPEDALVSLTLSRALLLIGDLDEATRAFDRALAKKPNRLDVLDAALFFGQSLLRANRLTDADRIWKQLDQLFPNDARVQERLAVTLSTGGDHAAAAGRFEQLSRATAEPNQRVLFQVRALEERVLNGTKLAELLGQFESLQSDLKTESWIAKDVGQRIEQLFLRTEDVAGLTAYYQKQAAARPEDIGQQTRLADLLARRGKLDDALAVLLAAQQKHPTNVALRRSVIGWLMKLRRFVDAQQQFAELDRIEPHNADTLRGWGQAVWQDESQPASARRDAALAIWMRLVESKPSDAIMLLQTAELLRRYDFEAEALALYQRAINAAPNEPQYREDFGDFLLSRNRRDEALAAWREIASGDRQTHENEVRLASILHRAGEREEALRRLGDACRDEATLPEFLKWMEWLREARRYDDLAGVLARAAKLATHDDEQQRVQQAELEWLLDSGVLFDEIIRAKQRGAQENSATSWHRLAVLCRAARRWDEALTAIRRAADLAPDSVPTLRESAQIAMSAERPQEALSIYRRLLAADPSQRGDILRQVATLESRLGHVDAAINAAREMIEVAPGQREYLDFFVNLCLQHGRVEEALASLRRAVRAFPNDVSLMMQLAGILAGQERLSEAIEIGWQGYAAAREPRDQVRIAERLALWHQQANRWPLFLERVERRKREPAAEYAATLSLAAGYRAVGDFEAARRELATQLISRPDDVELLRQLVLDAEAHHHWPDAAEFQRRLVERHSHLEERLKLVLLLDKSGDEVVAIEKARELAVELRDLPSVLNFADELLNRGHFELAARVLDARLRANDSEWAVRLRLGIALWRTGRQLGAQQRFRELLTLGRSGATATASPTSRLSSATSSGDGVSISEQHWQRRQAAIGIAAFLFPNEFTDPRLLPRDVAEARIAARAAILLIGRGAIVKNDPDAYFATLERIEPTLSTFAKRVLAASTRSDDKTQALEADELWVWYHALEPVVAQSRNVPLFRLRLRAALKLAEQPDVFSHWALLAAAAPQAAFNETSEGLPGFGLRYQELATLAELPELNDRLLASRKIVEAGPYEWMKPRVNRVGESTAAEFASAADLLKLPLERRPDDVSSTTLQRWGEAALAANDGPLFAQLLEHELRQVARSMTQPLKPEWHPNGRSLVALSQGRDARKSDDKLLLRKVSLQLLEAVLTSSQRPSVSRDVVSRFEKPFEREAADLRDLRVIARAFVMWRAGQGENAVKDKPATSSKSPPMLSEQAQAALQWLQAAVDESPQDYALRFELVLLLKEAQQVARAIEVLKQAQLNDSQSLFHRDRTLIELGQMQRDDATVHEAARRLASLTTNSLTEREIAALLINLKERDLALQKVNELRRRSGHDLSLLGTLLKMYQQLEQPQLAVSVAHDILTRVPEYPVKSQGTYTLESSTLIPDSLAVLEKAERSLIEPLIASLDAELQVHPQAARPRELLKTYRSLIGQADVGSVRRDEVAKAQGLTAQQLLDRARQLAAEGQRATACELSLLAYRRDSKVLLGQFAEARKLFEAADRGRDLLALLMELKLAAAPSLQDSVTAFALAQLADPQAADVATSVLIAAWSVIPAERLDEIGKLHHPHLWRQSSPFTQWALQAVIPQSAAAAKQPWLGIVSSDDQTSCALSRQLDANGRTAALREPTLAALQAYPQWKTGEVILALIDADEGRTVDFERRLTALATEPDLPLKVQFVIAQEIAKRQSVERMAIRVMEQLAKRPHAEARYLANDPAIVLAKVYRRAGQTDACVALLAGWLDQQSEYEGKTEPRANDEHSLRSIRNLDLVAAELSSRTVLSLDYRVRAQRQLASTSGKVPTRERLTLAADVLVRANDMLIKASSADADSFCQKWLVTDRPIELPTLLVASPNSSTLRATNLLAEAASTLATEHPELVAILRQRVRQQADSKNEPMARIVLLQLNLSMTTSSEEELVRDLEALVSANDSSAVIGLNAITLLKPALTHSSSRVRSIAARLATRATAAARQASSQWEAAVVWEELQAAHSLGDLAREEQLAKRLRELSAPAAE